MSAIDLRVKPRDPEGFHPCGAGWHTVSPLQWPQSPAHRRVVVPSVDLKLASKTEGLKNCRSGRGAVGGVVGGGVAGGV
jgi:hypothetical protein